MFTRCLSSSSRGARLPRLLREPQLATTCAPIFIRQSQRRLQHILIFPSRIQTTITSPERSLRGFSMLANRTTALTQGNKPVLNTSIMRRTTVLTQGTTALAQGHKPFLNASIARFGGCSRTLTTSRKSLHTAPKPTLWSHPMRKGLPIVGRMILYGYGFLALIPATFLVLAGFQFAQAPTSERMRGLLFYSVTGFLSLPLSMCVLLAAPVVLLFDTKRRKLLTDIQSLWGQLTCWLFMSPHIEGAEHLKAVIEDGRPVVFVSNHQSWLDIYAVLHLNVPILFVAKKAIFYIPVVGWVMGLIGHIGVERGDKNSRNSVLERCKAKLDDGMPVYFFAEGTRSLDGNVRVFRMGAFRLAAEAGVQVVPVSISGTGELMAPGEELWFKRDNGNVKIVVHEPVDFAQFRKGDMAGIGGPVATAPNDELNAFRSHVRDVILSSVDQHEDEELSASKELLG